MRYLLKLLFLITLCATIDQVRAQDFFRTDERLILFSLFEFGSKNIVAIGNTAAFPVYADFYNEQYKRSGISYKKQRIKYPSIDKESFYRNGFLIKDIYTYHDSSGSGTLIEKQFFYDSSKRRISIVFTNRDKVRRKWTWNIINDEGEYETVNLFYNANLQLDSAVMALDNRWASVTRFINHYNSLGYIDSSTYIEPGSDRLYTRLVGMYSYYIMDSLKSKQCGQFFTDFIEVHKILDDVPVKMRNEIANVLGNCEKVKVMNDNNTHYGGFEDIITRIYLTGKEHTICITIPNVPDELIRNDGWHKYGQSHIKMDLMANGAAVEKAYLEYIYKKNLLGDYATYLKYTYFNGNEKSCLFYSCFPDLRGKKEVNCHKYKELIDVSYR